MSKILYGATALVLASIVSPIVTSALRFDATTLDNLRQIGLAANQYAADNNGGVVLTQQGPAGSDKPWSVLLTPYLMTPSKSQTIFFDPIRAAVTTPTTVLGTATLPWYSVTSLSINDTGYSGRSGTVNGTCTARKIPYVYGQRNTATMVDPASRVAFAPTLYPGSPYGWAFFRSYDASVYRPGVAAGTFSWNNLVYDTRNFYSGGLIPVVHADGSAGTLNPSVDFKDVTKTPLVDQCAWLNGAGGKVWGKFWLAN